MLMFSCWELTETMQAKPYCSEDFMYVHFRLHLTEFINHYERLVKTLLDYLHCTEMYVDIMCIVEPENN